MQRHSHPSPMSSALSILGLFFVLAGCSSTQSKNAHEEATALGAAGHDPTHPPIDCPLRDQGLDPTLMRPFEEVADYIAFLERSDRAAWQKPDEIVAALHLSGDENIVDLGAGSGYFTFRFAQALPRGSVLATDTEPEMVRHMHHKVLAENLDNVRVELVQPGDPKIPEAVDIVFICDVLHHVPGPGAWLAKLAEQLRPGARVVLIEFKEGDLPEGPPESMKIGRKPLVKLASDAGLRLDSEHSDLLPYQTFLAACG
ncbi:MAG: SAM-dependent methyltransferase [Pseudohongiellaceae bacterium]|jgi:SAM-dependent methyltransferase